MSRSDDDGSNAALCAAASIELPASRAVCRVCLSAERGCIVDRMLRPAGGLSACRHRKSGVGVLRTQVRAALADSVPSNAAGPARVRGVLPVRFTLGAPVRTTAFLAALAPCRDRARDARGARAPRSAPTDGVSSRARDALVVASARPRGGRRPVPAHGSLPRCAADGRRRRCAARPGTIPGAVTDACVRLPVEGLRAFGLRERRRLRRARSLARRPRSAEARVLTR